MSDQPPGIVPPKESKSKALAWARLILALCSVALLTFVVVASFVTLWQGGKIDDLTRLLEVIFAPILAVVAAAVAFYYRSDPF